MTDSKGVEEYVHIRRRNTGVGRAVWRQSGWGFKKCVCVGGGVVSCWRGAVAVMEWHLQSDGFWNSWLSGRPFGPGAMNLLCCPQNQGASRLLLLWKRATETLYIYFFLALWPPFTESQTVVTHKNFPLIRKAWPGFSTSAANVWWKKVKSGNKGFKSVTVCVHSQNRTGQQSDRAPEE